MSDQPALELVLRTPAGHRQPIRCIEILEIDGIPFEEYITGKGRNPNEIFEIQQALAHLQGQVDTLENRLEHFAHQFYAAIEPANPSESSGDSS